MSEELAAKAAGALFYTLPSELKVAEQIDPLLRTAVATINASGWVWTAESCQGHPDELELMAPWGHNTQPFLRLVTRRIHLGAALAHLLLNAGDQAETLCGPPVMQLHVRELEDGFVEFMVYVKAHNVATRNRGCQALERFAFALIQKDPTR